jgi:hypothetical protein
MPSYTLGLKPSVIPVSKPPIFLISVPAESQIKMLSFVFLTIFPLLETVNNVASIPRAGMVSRVSVIGE